MDVDAFVDAVRRVASGGTALDPAVVAQLITRRGPFEDVPVAVEFRDGGPGVIVYVAATIAVSLVGVRAVSV